MLSIKRLSVPEQKQVQSDVLTGICKYFAAAAEKIPTSAHTIGAVAATRRMDVAYDDVRSALEQREIEAQPDLSRPSAGRGCRSLLTEDEMPKLRRLAR